MTQLYKTPFLPHLYCRLAFGQASWSRRGRKRFVSSINLSGWCSRAHSIRLLAVPLFAVFLFLLSGGSVCGQVVTGTLTGTVTDSTGATIPNAKVAITELSTNSERTTASSTDGRYDIPYLAPGEYRVEVSAAGFKTLTQADINISVSTVARFDAVLTPGSASETVTVTAAPPALQTESAEVSVNFGVRTVTDVPLEARNVQALAGLAAGVTPPAQSFGTVEDGPRTTFFNANGQSNSANNTIVDGVDNTDPILGLSIYLPPPEQVQEVHVSTSNYSAEFGRVAGAVVNETTRQGTNQFHGTLWEYNRVAALAAKDYFGGNLAKPPLTLNDFGAAVGGPVVKNNTFFFGAYHGVRQRSSSTSTGTVPLPAFLTGDFSSVPGAAIFNPFTGNPDGTGRTQFANNIIPQTLISGPAAAIDKFFPAPNLPGLQNNWVTNIPFSYNADNYTARVDHSFTELTKVFGETNISRYATQNPTYYPEPIGAGLSANDDNYTGIINFTHGFGPGLLTELRLGYNLYATNVVDTDKTLSNAQAGIADPDPYPISEEGLAFMNIGSSPTIAIGGSPYYPLKNRDNLFQVVNAWTKDLPNQSLKFGGEAHRNRLDRRQPQGLNGGPRGGFSFEPGTTQLNGGPGLGPDGAYVNGLAAYLLGAPQELSRTFMTQTPTNRQTQFALFFQDTYHATPKLVLDLGIRYEFYSPIKPKGKGGASNYDPTTNDLLVAGYGSGNVDLANGVSSQSLTEPRVGFAYSIDNQSVVRGGFALSGWIGRFGFTGGTLSTQFPVIYNVQVGNTGGYGLSGSIDSLPAVPFITIPVNGIIAPAPNQAFFVIPTRNPVPYVEAYNLTYQRSLGHGFVTNIGYVGNVGRHLPASVELNAAAPGTGTAGLRLASFGRTASTQLRGDLTSSNYNALQVNMTRSFSNGFSMTLGYAYSRSLDLGSNQPGFTDNLNLARQYGPSDFDSTHNLVVSHVYELPFGKGKQFMNQGGIGSLLLSGWQLNGILRLLSGTPFTITSDATSCDCPGNGQFGEQVAPVHYPHSLGQWFSTSSFAPPPANQFGNVGRNSVRGPTLKQYDFSLFRGFHIWESVELQARGEFYNLTNTPNFSNPDSTVTDSTFGTITSTTGNARAGQIALKLLF
jgi:outer membrane receptor protein involved in Fe transport